MDKLFMKATRNGNDYLCSYKGMDQSTVTALATDLGCTNIQFVAEDEFRSYVDAVPKFVATDLSNVKAVLRDSKSTTDDKLNALIQILGF